MWECKRCCGARTPHITSLLKAYANTCDQIDMIVNR